MPRKALRSLALSLLIVLPAALLVACADQEAPVEPQPVADLGGLSEGWNEIAADGEAVCSDGSDYRFFVRPGDPEKLAIYFQGGGGCWDGATCDPHIQPSYTMSIGDFHPSQRGGIFDFENPANPLADYSIVFAPYCTGDVHLGDHIATYEAPTVEDHEGHSFELHHRGHANADSVLAWTYDHFFAPTHVFVSGSSAGSIPSPYYAMLIAEQYEGSVVAQLGDGSGGYRRTGEFTPETSWKALDVLGIQPEFAGMTSADFNYEALYVAAAKRHPNLIFAAYDTAEDNVQKRFLELGGTPAEALQPLLDANQADIRSEVDNFRSFVAAGELHTILGRPELYSYRVGEIALVDWLADLAAGETVPDVHCGACEYEREQAGGQTSD